MMSINVKAWLMSIKLSQILYQITNKVVIFLLIGVLSSCASILSSSKYPISINSSPTDRIYKVYNRSGELVQKGSTPDIIELDAQESYMKREAYRVQVVDQNGVVHEKEVNFHVDGWYATNILFFIGYGLPGYFIIDPMAGAMFTINRDDIILTFYLNDEVWEYNYSDQIHLRPIHLAEIPDDLQDSIPLFKPGV